MSEETAGAAKARELIDTKYGRIDPASLVLKKDKRDKDFATAAMTTIAGKKVEVYAHGARVEELRKLAEVGEPVFVTGELLARGKGISASSFAPKTYRAEVESIGKEGSLESGPWAAVKLKVEGKDWAWNVLLTGDDVAKAKANVGKTIEVDLVWRATNGNGRWSSSPISANALTREPQPA